MLPLDALKMEQKKLFFSGRKHRVEVLVALAGSNHYLIFGEVEVLDSQTRALFF
ncbi:MAG: hypothetical protein AAB279_05890 [Candidatus Binatota bacterium]